MKFGFLLDEKAFDCSNFSIRPVSGYKELVAGFYDSARVSEGWLYGPEIELQKTSLEEGKFKQPSPTKCSTFYQVQPTHEVLSADRDQDYSRFLILGYGFLQGLYLIPEKHSHLGKTAYEKGKLNSQLLIGDDYVNGMEQVGRFYLSATSAVRRQIYASIHWFLLGQMYDFAWDKFDAQYKVLDGLYKASGIKAKSHADRPVALAKKYGIRLPKWAELDASGKSELSKQRNELFHEARYAKHPIGWSFPSENYSLEFRAFNTKLIAAALGINTPYLKADPTDRNIWRWNIT